MRSNAGVQSRRRRDAMGGSAPIGTVPSSFHAAHRNVRLHRLRSSNKRDRSGKPAATAARRSYDTRAAARSRQRARSTNSLEQRRHRSAKRGEPGLRCGRLRDHEQPHRRLPGERIVDDCGEAASHFITEHGFSDRLVHGDAHERSGIARERVTAVKSKDGVRRAPAASPQALEVGLAAQAGEMAHQTVRR